MVSQKSESFLCLIIFNHKMDVIKYEVRDFEIKYTPPFPLFFSCFCNLPCEVLALLCRYYAKVTDVEMVSDIHKVLSSLRAWSCKSIADTE